MYQPWRHNHLPWQCSESHCPCFPRSWVLHQLTMLISWTSSERVAYRSLSTLKKIPALSPSKNRDVFHYSPYKQCYLNSRILFYFYLQDFIFWWVPFCSGQFCYCFFQKPYMRSTHVVHILGIKPHVILSWLLYSQLGHEESQMLHVHCWLRDQRRS